MAMGRRELYGVLAACTSSLTGGTAVVMTRALIGETDPATLGVLRYGIGAVCLLFLVRLRRLPMPGRQDIVPVALLGLLFFTGFPWLFNKSLSLTTASHGSIALSTLPFLTLLIAAMLRAERMTLWKLVGVAVATAGVAVALSSRGASGGGGAAASPVALPVGWIGDLLMVATALCGAIYNVLARPYLARVPALSFTAAAMLAGTAGMACLAIVGGEPARVLAFDGGTWALVAVLGVAGGALAFFLWTYGLEHTTPTRVAITVTLNPVSALALGTTLLGEPWSGRLLIGLAAVASGILLANKQSNAGRQSTPSALAAAAGDGAPGAISAVPGNGNSPSR